MELPLPISQNLENEASANRFDGLLVLWQRIEEIFFSLDLKAC